MKLRTAFLLATAITALIGGALWLKAEFDVTGELQLWSRAIQDYWIHTRTDDYAATLEDVDQAIEAARADPILSALPRGPTRGPLRRPPDGGPCFLDRDGNPVLLAGSHTWSNLVDNGHGYPPPAFDYARYLDFLEAHGHNFTRLWAWESPRWSVQTLDDDYWFDPMPYARTGPGNALDGKPRFDLTRFNEEYFDRLESRVEAARERGIYVAVMLFNGWSVTSSQPGVKGRNPWKAHPYNAANNVNGIQGDENGDEDGQELHELGNREAIRAQVRYVRKVVDTLAELDNVLYEVSNESHFESLAWQRHIAQALRRREEYHGVHHPVGITATFPRNADKRLLASGADWIAPKDPDGLERSEQDPIVIADSDHVFGIGGNASWVRRVIDKGCSVAFMDGYRGAAYGAGGAGFEFEARRWMRLRSQIGYARSTKLAQAVAPQGNL